MDSAAEVVPVTAGMTAASVLGVGAESSIAKMTKMLGEMQSVRAAAMGPSLAGMTAASVLGVGAESSIAKMTKVLGDFELWDSLSVSLEPTTDGARSLAQPGSLGRELTGAEKHALAIWAATMALSLCAWLYVAHPDTAERVFNWIGIVGWAYSLYRLALGAMGGRDDQN